VKDKYANFAELAKNEKEGKDFLLRCHRRAANIVVIAPHGGGIEPGTSELAEAIAGDDLSLYVFEGIKKTNNRDLHITSAHFDEPQCLAYVRAADLVVAVHGEESKDELVIVGGLDKAKIQVLDDVLRGRGFRVETDGRPGLQALDQRNICNQGRRGVGLQMELSAGLRQVLFKSLTRAGRQTRKPRFHNFVDAVRAAIL
jgi:phage replication-related protein YjqB (UPF0714/DUF867 family)